jgi:hypothetical protein
MVVAFLPQVMTGQPPQLFIDKRHQLIERGFVAACPIDQQLGDFAWRG